MATIEYFYSVRSVYAYFGAVRIADLAQQHGRSLVHKPIDLGRVVAGFGSQPIAARSAKHKERYFGRELELWSEFLGIPVNVDPQHHFGDRVPASAAVLAAQAQGLDTDALSHAILQALWRDDRDVADAAVLAALCRDVGIEPGCVLGETAIASVAVEFESCTQEAIARGVPGSPTYSVDGELFYGQDRLALVERALQRPFARTAIAALSW